ncbi:TIGR04222 domain-containing membrane protein [Streptomyces sp. NPDC093018]|uniref:TIGR04222 domain-containing membrane protein n=1 Tax=Streptomyces sp. NPDC093018 TaxID=3155067 RepID=UPI0034242239
MFWLLLLLLAWVFTGTACVRLCLAAMRAAAADPGPDPGGVAGGHDLTLYEAAFLSGGPQRVADVTLLSMARQRRLHLAHTGWATVVDPLGRDEIERSVIGAIGPDGQSRIAPVRTRAAHTDAVRRLADRLVRSGLAVPDAAGPTIAAAVRQVRAAALAVAVLAVAALLMPIQADTSRLMVGLWFLLPFTLSLSCLAIARFEVHPYSPWASAAGQRVLGALRRRRSGDEPSFLTAVALRGIRAIGEPELRAAFAHRDAPHRE